jgi:hypothetical protein
MLILLKAELMARFKTFYSFEKTKESVGFLFLYFFIEPN